MASTKISAFNESYGNTIYNLQLRVCTEHFVVLRIACYNILWYDCPVRLILAKGEQSCSTPIMKLPWLAAWFQLISFSLLCPHLWRLLTIAFLSICSRMPSLSLTFSRSGRPWTFWCPCVSPTDKHSGSSWLSIWRQPRCWIHRVIKPAYSYGRKSTAFGRAFSVLIWIILSLFAILVLALTIRGWIV